MEKVMDDHHVKFRRNRHRNIIQEKDMANNLFESNEVFHHQLDHKLEGSWGTPIEGFGMHTFSLKLHMLKDHLKRYKEVFGNVFDAVKAAEMEVKARKDEYKDSPPIRENGYL
ncbi:hypothetical protein ACH5RR_033726 [Cinchona calisaya]|uniref:Uncharacterized protein n=1 Tax=Cinchona calisaya TaxID=153742 RepID=A0ABD2Y9T0_9GENT